MVSEKDRFEELLYSINPENWGDRDFDKANKVLDVYHALQHQIVNQTDSIDKLLSKIEKLEADWKSEIGINTNLGNSIEKLESQLIERNNQFTSLEKLHSINVAKYERTEKQKNRLLQYNKNQFDAIKELIKDKEKLEKEKEEIKKFYKDDKEAWSILAKEVKEKIEKLEKEKEWLYRLKESLETEITSLKETLNKKDLELIVLKNKEEIYLPSNDKIEDFYENED